MRTTALLSLSCLFTPHMLFAQNDPQPYAGFETRAIKALSPDEVRGYLEGRGMGFAKAAELNHYPGPRHVLELADQLDLSGEQRAATRLIFERMTVDARRLGRHIVELEHGLDSVFASGSAENESVRLYVERIATLSGALRLRHLGAHLEMKRVLTPHQVMLYDRLRGYGGDGAHDHRDREP